MNLVVSFIKLRQRAVFVGLVSLLTVFTVAFAHDGKTLVAGGNGPLHIWQATE